MLFRFIRCQYSNSFCCKTLLKISVKRIPHFHPVPCFLCCLKKTEQSPLLGIDGRHRERNGGFKYGLTLSTSLQEEGSSHSQGQYQSRASHPERLVLSSKHFHANTVLVIRTQWISQTWNVEASLLFLAKKLTSERM